MRFLVVLFAVVLAVVSANDLARGTPPIPSTSHVRPSSHCLFLGWGDAIEWRSLDAGLKEAKARLVSNLAARGEFIDLCAMYSIASYTVASH